MSDRNGTLPPSEDGADYHLPPEEQERPDNNDVRCGTDCCAPVAMQRCAAIGPFTANISGLFFVNVAFFTYFLGTIRTLEKRFDLSSTESSVTLVMMDLMFAVLSLVIGYLGQHAHKPHAMVICQVLTSVGIFILALPIVVYGPKKMETEHVWSSPTMQAVPSEAAVNKMIGLCVPSALLSNASDLHALSSLASGSVLASLSPPDDCIESLQTTESRQAYVLMLGGSLLIGLGGVAVSTLGIPYIDENIDSSDSACYIGVATSTFSWAPIIGLLLAALCTMVPESLFDNTGLKPSHPSYIGAWWLGMVILATLSLFLAIPMLFFPKHLRHYYTATTNSTNRKLNTEQVEEGNFMSTLKAIPRQTIRFLTNGPYVTLLLSKICCLYGVTGVILQLPRYLEIHYRQPAYIATIIAAFSGGIVGALGTVLGGIAVRCLKLDTRGIALMFTLATGFGVLGTAVCMTFGCPQPDLDGTWDATKQVLDVTSECSVGCECSDSMFIPVCTEDKHTFFSPCHAGCHTAILNNNTYLDCKCTGPVTEAVGGYCNTDTCQTIIPYVITFVIVSFLVAFGRVPATILMFRLVDEEAKAPVMGLTSFFVNILCFVPAPVLFGMLFDSACLVWKSSCSGTGACLFYDIRKFRLLMHGVTLCFQVPSLLFAGLTLYLVRRRTGSKELSPSEAVALSNTSGPLLEQNLKPSN